MLANETNSEFWNRVIPGELRKEAIANDVVLSTRGRKRPSTFNTDPPSTDLGGGRTGEGNASSKRRRLTRNGRRGASGNDEELSTKEQRALLRSLRQFGDPNLARSILLDAGLEDRI